MFRIFIYSHLADERPSWRDSLEGPFDEFSNALAFAENEIGCAWVVVNEAMKPMMFGDGIQSFPSHVDFKTKPKHYAFVHIEAPDGSDLGFTPIQWRDGHGWILTDGCYMLLDYVEKLGMSSDEIDNPIETNLLERLGEEIGSSAEFLGFKARVAIHEEAQA